MVLRKRAHLTEAARVVSGVTSHDYWEFQPGQRVKVVEGFLGVVVDVEDGPHPGSEQYLVSLDDGMGGGNYSSSELTAASEVTVEAIWVDTPASNALFDLASQIAGQGNQAMVWEPEFEGDKPWRISDGDRGPHLAVVGDDDEADIDALGSNHTAAEDYPELGTILEDRPPLAHAVTGAKTAAKVPATNYNLLWEPSLAHVRALADTVDWDAIPVTTIAPGAPLYSSEEFLSDTPIDKVVSGREPFREGYDCYVVVDEHGRMVVVDGNHRAAMYRAMGKPMPAHVYDSRKTAGILDRLLDPYAKSLEKRLTPEFRPGAQGEGSRYSYDWCRFRKNRRCMYAKEIDVQGSQEAGYAVWLPVDRGLCPRDPWELQEACPVAEPGPHSGHPNARIEATVPWSQGGQRGGIPERLASMEKDAAYVWKTTGEEVTQDEILALAEEHGLYSMQEMRNKMGDGHTAWSTLYNEIEKKVLYPLTNLSGGNVLVVRTIGPWGGDAPPRKPNRVFSEEELQTYRDFTAPVPQEFRDWIERRRRGEGRYDALPTAAAKAPFEFFAAWKDIQEKAKRIRAAGGVVILASDGRYVAGQVNGDAGTYETRLEYAAGPPGARAIAMWDCTCPWSNYSWGRTRQWKKFEGRQCAHALALAWEAQSRGMFGKEIEEDTQALASKFARALPGRTLRKANPTLEDIVDWVMQIIRQVEDRITRDMKNVVRRSSVPVGDPAGWVVGRLEGLGFKFKSQDSLLRKFREKLAEGGSLEDPFFLVKDALRYTMVFSDVDWSRDVQRATYALEELGYRVHKSDNTWQSGDSYSGLHYTLSDPQDTLFIELQFHTGASFELKQEKLHLLYEEYREKSTPVARRKEIWAIFVAAYEHLPVPAHALEWQELKAMAPNWLSPAEQKRWKPGDRVSHRVSIDPSLAEAPAVSMAALLLSEGIAFPLVAEALTALGAKNGLAIVTQAMAHPIRVQVPGKGLTTVIDLNPSTRMVTLEDGSEVPASRAIYPTFHPTKGLSLTGLKLADTNATGVMVALRPPTAVCEALEFEGGEDAENMHITLCYLGDKDDVDREALDSVVVEWARTVGPLTGRIGGFGQFINEGEAVLVALWDIPGLDRFRLSIKDSLAVEKVMRTEDHGFTAHTTIAYGTEPFDELPELPDEARGQIVFDTVVVAYGGEWQEFPLTGPASSIQPLQQAAALAPFPPHPTYMGNDAIFGRAGEGAVVDMRRALVQMVSKCPKCGHLVGFTGQCQACGYIGPKIGALVDDALQMISDGYAAGLVEEDAVSWFAPTDAGQAIARDRIGPEIANVQVTVAVAGDTYVTTRTESVVTLHLGECPIIQHYRFSVGVFPSVQKADPELFAGLSEEYPDRMRYCPTCMGGKQADLHDPDEAALPSTTGDEDDEDWEIPHGEVPAPGSPKLSWLMGGPQAPAAAAADSLDIATAAREALAKMGVKTFTPAEQRTIIEEGAEVTAGNLALLDITGTHYETLEAAFQEAEEDEDGLWL